VHQVGLLSTNLRKIHGRQNFKFLNLLVTLLEDFGYTVVKKVLNSFVLYCLTRMLLAKKLTTYSCISECYVRLSDWLNCRQSKVLTHKKLPEINKLK
jgi:hypothetical protein